MRIKKAAGITLICFVTLLLTTTAYTEELPVFYKGIRPLGMGGAFTAVADDANAMFYNPAGLNNIDTPGMEILSPFVEITGKEIDFIKDLRKIGDANTDAEQTQLATELLENWLGENLHLRTGLFPNFTKRNFGIGVLAQGSFNGRVNDPLGSKTLELKGTKDVAGLVSIAYGSSNVKGHRLQIGATGKYIFRQALDQAYTTLDLIQQGGIDPNKDFQKGSGFGIDLGAIYTWSIFLNPSFGAVIQNLFDTNLGDAGQLESQINVGVALKPPIKFGKFVAAFDIVDATRQLGTDNDLGKRLHTGIEYKFPMILELRAGFYQGYFSAGATVDFLTIKLSYAMYAEELGSTVGQLPDRRHVVQLSLGF